MNNETKRWAEATLQTRLEWMTFEEFLELFDLTPEDVLIKLVEVGFIDLIDLEELEAL